MDHKQEISSLFTMMKSRFNPQSLPHLFSEPREYVGQLALQYDEWRDLIMIKTRHNCECGKLDHDYSDVLTRIYYSDDDYEGTSRTYEFWGPDERLLQAVEIMRSHLILESIAMI